MGCDNLNSGTTGGTTGGGEVNTPTAVSFKTLTANGTSDSVTTTALTFTFDKDPTGFTAENITVTGATKVALTGSGPTRTLAISNITKDNGGTVTVTLTNPSGLNISPLSMDVTISKFSLGLIMKDVPAGKFQRDETTANISVITNAYRMSQHEITRAQWKKVFTGAGEDPSSTFPDSDDTHPVQKVNWYHAIAFCNKLSIKEGLEPVYSVMVGGTEVDWQNLAFDGIPTGDNADWNAATDSWDSATNKWTKNGYRLPTEMEWMWAAMGANKTATDMTGDVNTKGYLKAFAGSTGSNAIGDCAWYSGNSVNKTHQVGTAGGGDHANELGLYDMSGNVSEWCWDRSGGSPVGEASDYRGADTGSSHNFRGGSWCNNADYCTVAKWFSADPNYQINVLGFRVVRP